jgi:hypothetical protein
VASSGSGLKEVIFERESSKKKSMKVNAKSRNEAGFDICSDLRLQKLVKQIYFFVL